ncbi:MAG: HEAT repeat domain-containing protein [Gemmatimonadota bacterium]|nr:HEAT repeat domain-containing protein [Gemmatimonadota bacterium]
MVEASSAAQMISKMVVLAFVTFQLGLLAGLIWFALSTDRRKRWKNRAELKAVASLRQTLLWFVVFGDNGEELAAKLAALPPARAARQVERMGVSLFSAEPMERLAMRIRNEPWVVGILAGASSRLWWRRMNAARLLVFVCRHSDQELLAKLVMDRNPAVAAAATSGVAAHAGPALVEAMVRNLANEPMSVRQQQMLELRSHADIAGPILLSVLEKPSSINELEVMIQFAEILGTAPVLNAIVGLANHPQREVRARVARALRAAFVPGAERAALKLLDDPDWRVRAAAARALEGLNSEAAIPALSIALHDAEWWVRFRAALALGGLGPAGQSALGRVSVSDDLYAAEMAISVQGLTEANRLELGT